MPQLRIISALVHSSAVATGGHTPLTNACTPHFGLHRTFFGASRNDIGGQVDRASTTEVVDSGSIPGRVKPKTIKIGIQSFPARLSAIKGTV